MENEPSHRRDVQALTPRTAEAVIWNFVDALSAGNGQKAQSLLHRFLEDDEQFYVWSMIIRQFRLMLLAREVLDGGGGVPEVMKALRSAEYPAKKALEAARHFNMPRLEQIYHRLLEIDEGRQDRRNAAGCGAGCAGGGAHARMNEDLRTADS